VAGPPSTTWDELVGELALEPHELAFQLLQGHSFPRLTTGRAFFAGLVSPSTTSSVQALLLNQSSLGEPTCTLVAMQGQVSALHDLQEVFEMNAQGGHCATLGGDSGKIAGQIIFPDPCEQPETASHAALIAKLTTQAVVAHSWEAIMAALQRSAFVGAVN
jgi:hypothetical protein